MSQRITKPLIVVVVVLLAAIYIVLPNSPGINFMGLEKQFATVLGLDLQGGIQMLLEANLAPGTTLEPGAIDAAVGVLSNRISGGLGVIEGVVQKAGDNRIVVEMPGQTDTEKALAVVQQEGLLELVPFTELSAQEALALVNTYINTNLGAAPVITNTAPVTRTFTTLLTGAEVKSVAVTNQAGQYEVSFNLTSKGAQTFADFTSANVGKILAIVVDKRVISVPSINQAITQGSGVITGNFDYEEANNLAIQLRYGSLPVALSVVEIRTVGPTLGQDSLRRSMIAGLIGFAIIILFMLFFYRLPGLVADLAMLVFGVVLFAIFRFLPVTLTLPGIAGLMLSIGSALDANILIFERVKEELRAGKPLRQAVDLGFRRAWSSIRDSNAATIITSAILFWFGSTYGATIVKGFSITLFLGVAVSLFTALVVTRLLMEVVVSNFKSKDYAKWFGI